VYNLRIDRKVKEYADMMARSSAPSSPTEIRCQSLEMARLLNLITPATTDFEAPGIALPVCTAAHKFGPPFNLEDDRPLAKVLPFRKAAAR
jgi:hypothetical protein